MSLTSTAKHNHRTILKLAFPLLLGQLGNIAVSFADNIMVGHYSTDALASASFVNNVFNIAILACIGFANGLTPIVGALFVKGDNSGIGRIVRVALKVNICFALVITALMTALYFNVHRLGQPEHLLPVIRPYYLTVLCGILPCAIFSVFAQWCFALGKTGLPTWIILSANAINIAGNYVLIYGHFGAPELGLLGAGISTLTARILCMVVICLVFFNAKFAGAYRPGFRNDRRREGDTEQVFTTGFPVAMQTTFETASFSGAAVMAGWIGAIDLAAFQIVVISGMIGFCIYFSIAGAMAIPISHAAGQNDNAAMRRWAWAGYHIVLSIMVIVCVILLSCGHHIMGIFTNDPAVIGLAVTLLVPMALYQFGDATQITFANALRGTSKVMPMLYIAFVSYIIIGLPLAWIMAFPAGMNLYGIVLSFTACLLVAAVLYLYYFLRATKEHPIA